MHSGSESLRPQMMALQSEFMAQFKQNGGFGIVEGSKWQHHISRDRFKQEEIYLTKEQIEDKEKSANSLVALSFMQTLRIKPCADLGH